jgi:hypothetical protein
MKDVGQNRTYKVRLLCRNCDTEWIEDVEKGIYIRYEKDNNYMIKPGDLYENRKLFKCPKCRANKKIARLSLK